MEKDLLLKISFIGAFILSLLGAILLLVGEFAGWGYYYASQEARWSSLSGYQYYYNIGSGSGTISALTPIYGGIVILVGIMLLCCTAITFIAFKFPEKIRDKKYILGGVLLSFVAFLLTLIGGAVFAVEISEYDVYWWFGEGFYGALIGGLLTTIFLLVVYKNIEL